MTSVTRGPRLYRSPSSDSISTISSSSSSTSDSSSSSEYNPGRSSRHPRSTNHCDHHAARPHKSSTEQILIRARNANIPATYVQSQKRNQLLQKKQKTKSREQIDAEERRMLERKAELEEDPLLDASRMRPDRVWCIPCDKHIQIDSRR